MVLGFEWKLRVKIGKSSISVEIVGEYWYSKSFLVLRILSTGTESRVPILNVVFSLKDVEYSYLKLSTGTES